MPNRFGVRHAILALLLLALAVSVWLNMLQLDRVWERLGDVRATQSRLEESVVRLEKRLAAPAPHTTAAPQAGTTPPAPEPAKPAQDAWARPGVAIKRTPRPAWITDPTSRPDYAEGGVITEGLDADLKSFTPYNAGKSTAVSRRVLELVQERLADYHPSTIEMQGMLAEAWQMDPGGLWLRAKIRDDANWSDGEPVTAGDVKFTIELIRNPAYGATRFQSQFEAVESVEALAPKVVEVTFRESLYVNEDGTLRVAPLPAHIYSKLTPDQFKDSTGFLVGSGPYMLPSLTIDNQWAPKKPLELVRNPRWRGPKRPADIFRIVVINDVAARLAALRNGEIDLIRGNADMAASLGTDTTKPQHAVSWPLVTQGPAFITWNTGNRADGKPSCFADRRVRLAITHALDRERMIRDLFGGLGTVATGPFHPSLFSSDPAITPLPFDLATANTLLDDAGWKRTGGGNRANAEGTPLSYRIIAQKGTANAEFWSSYLRDQAALLGAACTVEFLDNAVFTADRDAHNFDGFLGSWSLDSPEPTVRQYYHSASIKDGDNDGQWNNPEADQLIDQARRTLDPTRRALIWRRFHTLLHREQPTTFIAWRPNIQLLSSRLGNFNPYPMGFDKSEMYVRKTKP